MLTIEPIGYFHTSSQASYDVSRQAALMTGNEGVIQLKVGCQFEQALEGLEGFERIWVLFHFHRHTHWKPKVLPPRGGKKQGVFATRAPHRPNFIGLSCVQLRAIKGLQVFVVNHDLLEGTPILDIKPYLHYADAFPGSRQGWVDELPADPGFHLEWSALAQAQVDYLASQWNCHLQAGIAHRLKQSPLPYPNNRIKLLADGWLELAYRTWRIYYQIEGNVLKIDHLKSGYDQATLQGIKSSQWEDVPIHQMFMQKFIHK